MGLRMMYPVTVGIFNVNFNHVMTKLFDMKLLEGTGASTAASMFNDVNIINGYRVRQYKCQHWETNAH